MVKPEQRPSGSADVVVVTMPAQLDVTNAEAVRADLLTALDSEVTVVVADLAATEYCDSTGFRILATVHQDGFARGRQLRLVVTPAGVVARTLAVLELDGLLEVYPSVSEALAV